MNFQHIHHVAILASDYKKTKEFYVEKLGFEVIRENYREDREDYKIDLQLGDSELEVFVVKNAPARPNYPEALGLRHLAFTVEDIEDTVKRLNEKGIETEPIRWDTYTNKSKQKKVAK